MVTNVRQSLDKLSKKDIYSLLMFVLFKANEVPELAVLSQLIYLLDEDNFIKLIKYFGGQKIVVPTLNEVRELIYTLICYKSIDIDNISFEETLKLIPDDLKESILAKYDKIKSIMLEYSFV